MHGSRHKKRACDRCHVVKEKCRWNHGQSDCERCKRLQAPCQSTRPIATPGRRPRAQLLKAASHRSSTSESSTPTNSLDGSDIEKATSSTPNLKIIQICKPLSIYIDLNERELQLLNGIPRGNTRIDQFLVGTSFHASHRRTFLRHLCKATSIIQDAVIASSALIAYEDATSRSPEDRIIGHRRAALAISSLRSLTNFDPTDLSTVLMLSASAVTFALHISGSALAICRHSLHLIRSFYKSSEELDSECLAFLICLIHSEIAECLMQCELPTFRFELPYTGPFVDRFLGVASPLLSYLYDVCDISHRLRLAEKGTSESTILEILTETEIAVSRWQPILPNDFAIRYPPNETTRMLAQANIHKSGILLLCHRLRHPYGKETVKGLALSEVILKEIRHTVDTTGRSLPCVDIAFISACFEVIDTDNRQLLLNSVQTVVEFSNQLQSKIRDLLHDFWRIRDTQDEVYWYSFSTWLKQ